MKNVLPNKPSTLIRLAITDLIKCENSPNYKIDMGVWHAANSVCRVCLAGAVMAQTIHIDRWKSVEPYNLVDDAIVTPTDEHKLEALDYFRSGNIKLALEAFDIDFNLFEIENENYVSYNDNPTLFKKQMRGLATQLQRAGL